MPRIVSKPDTLDDLNGNYAQERLTRNVFINSVPKCGTHLVRNIFRMFVPVDQQYKKAFIQLPILDEHKQAFNPKNPELSWGHLLFSDISAFLLHETHKLVLVRDPYDWVIARARFLLSDNFEGNMDVIKSGRVSMEEILNLMIFGMYQKAPTLQEIYTHNALAWLGTGAKLVRFEDVLHHVKHLDTPEAEAYFSDLLSILGHDKLPEDWRERVRVGADREQSGTYRDNLRGLDFEFPKELPETQKRLVDVHAPGLRAILGYTS
ncbi:hypothetical protein [Aliidiomarina sanyensis]|uniref:Sulfotransferase domain-containing protein n=1 Tax=Aliidiomarina sanyensis TaxID=1249555 RepID=A0A432WNK0_9GAMM|nr:hypothetical protein [Aliidiomarina sanyensis]RUO35354.1 hypothetical protein CWE11_04895 [Aliidiomarina sanyensis]